MKIKTSTPNLTKFSDVKAGDCFYANDKYFLKANAHADGEETTSICVDIQDGEVYFFKDDVEVKLVNASLDIEVDCASSLTLKIEENPNQGFVKGEWNK